MYTEEELWNFGKIEVCVFFIFLLLLLLLPIGFLRRRHNSIALKTLAWGIYTSTALLVPYAFGLMRSFDHGAMHSYFSIRGVFLVYVYGSVDRVNALNLNDRATVIVLWVKNIVHFAFAFSLVYDQYFYDAHHVLYIPLFGCLFYSYYKVVERVAALQYANGDDSRLAELITDVSKSINERNNYVVGPRHKTDKAITFDEVKTCKEATEGLKSTCLSFSLFWLLLHRFVGVPSYEGLHREAAWEFAIRELLKHDASGGPLSVIEVELTFLYDFIYSKYFSFFMKGFCCQVMKQVVCHGLFISFLVTHKTRPITRVVTLTIVAMEFLQFVVFLCSRWPKMMLICMYLRRESAGNKWNICDCCIKAAIHIISPKHGCRRFKPWQRKLGQYSLLESSSSRRTILWKISSKTMHALSGIQMVRPGRKDSDGVTLTDEIKKAVIQPLEVHGPRLSNGIASLDVGDPAIKEKILNACNNLYTDAHVILAWHIATSICEINHQADSPHFRVATSLSKYCAYLVAFAPELLPGHASTTDYICTMTINHADTLMKGCGSPKERCDKLKGSSTNDFEDSEAGQILKQGAVLGKVLDTEITDVWTVLAKFWAEMILYLAPNMNNEWEHVKRLADGGEFITHLWALLFHAGIVDRSRLFA